MARTIFDMSQEEIVDALVQPLKRGTERSQGRLPTDLEFMRLCEWVWGHVVDAAIAQGLVEGKLTVSWERDDWILRVDDSTPLQEGKEGIGE